MISWINSNERVVQHYFSFSLTHVHNYLQLVPSYYFAGGKKKAKIIVVTVGVIVPAKCALLFNMNKRNLFYFYLSKLALIQF